jgi:hypothetical protein
MKPEEGITFANADPLLLALRGILLALLEEMDEDEHPDVLRGCLEEDIADAVADAWQEYRRRHNHDGKCRVCGCTHDKACEPPCWWEEPDLCSTCAQAAATSGAH